MAGNFWKSSHYEQWILEKHDLLRERGEDFKIFAEEEYQKLMIFFVEFICKIGQDMKIRMQTIATACIYFRRFYARRSFRDIDPFLLAPTCLTLASKVEESGMIQTNKLIPAVQGAFKKWPYINRELAIRSHLAEAEFCVLEIMDCCLIVYHPYRPLNQMIQDMKNSGIKDTDQIHQDAWRVCNDCLKTDALLLYAPHLIAITAIVIALISNGREKDKDLKLWLSFLAVDYKKVFEIQQMIFNMYRIRKNFDEPRQLPYLLEKLPWNFSLLSCKREC